ncbi:PASTA domain-containing protein [Nocardioides sp. W3-2-3]|uniref:penicillin-binding transpeptidase domain-containing protein n=1 Tax=Nocardioides convexus TaxID=2712224 RepID=UPI002418460D|nr:penicillin-binding transpeptidase domain-containing protein [Nocardioides convexus]NHA00808.1 PASTA domain-containing protein [Nocardioides convexus]
MSPLDMAQAYATFAARGIHCAARPVTEIADTDGNVLKTYDKSCSQVIASPIADAVNDVLRGVIAPGGFGAALSPGVPAAGKTGTTNGNLSVWFSGYTPNLAGASVVAGVKKNGNQDTLDGKSIGGYVRGSTSGSTTAGPIWGDTFKAIAQYLPGDDFVRPSSTDVAGLLVPVPSVAGKSYDDAKATLEGLGFDVARGPMVDSGYARGLVSYRLPLGRHGPRRRRQGDAVPLRRDTQGEGQAEGQRQEARPGQRERQRQRLAGRPDLGEERARVGRERDRPDPPRPPWQEAVQHRVDRDEPADDERHPGVAEGAGDVGVGGVRRHPEQVADRVDSRTSRAAGRDSPAAR